METDIIRLGRQNNLESLTNLIKEAPTNQLIEITLKQLNSTDANLTNAFLNYLLIGISETDSTSMKTKRYILIKSILEELNKIDLSSKKTTNIIQRIAIELPKFEIDHLIEFAEYCYELLKIPDLKCLVWKELLPDILMLINGMENITVNNVQMSGNSYRQKIIQNIYILKWPNTILTSIALMFQSIPITKEERIIIVQKLCIYMQELHPNELPPLTYQLFLLCNNSAELVIKAILKLHKYFYKCRYHKIISNLESDLTDYNSIDCSDEEYREAEETVLYHLDKCTEFQITEYEIIANIRVLSSTPHHILKPFTLSCLLTISDASRHPCPSKISTSNILMFLRNVIKNNEMEKELRNNSAWCRDTLNQQNIDMEQIFSILIDQCTVGSEIVTPGLINLLFVLLKTQNNSNLNSLAIDTLSAFIKKRFIFGRGILLNLTDLLIANHDVKQKQYVECLIKLSAKHTLTVSECKDSIKKVLECFLKIPGNSVMQMMTFIFPLIKISSAIRENFIEILRIAMFHRELSTRRMAVYGFCNVLKLLNNNTRRNCEKSVLSQYSLSQYSLSQMSTTVLKNTIRNNFDNSSLEILGILTICFRETSEIKCELYEGLTKAIKFNHKLIPLVLRFIENHFLSYFNIDDLNFEIKYDIIIQERNGQIYIYDHLGKLINFIGDCIINCEKYEITCNNINTFKKIIESLIDRIDVLSVEQLGIIGQLDEKMNIIGTQHLNTIEALMAYAIWTATDDNTNLNKIIKLFKYHSDCLEALKKASVVKKGKKLQKNVANTLSQNLKPTKFKPENIWQLNTIERFLHVIYCDKPVGSVTNPLQSNHNFVRHLLSLATINVRSLHTKLDYLQITFSQTYFDGLWQITKIIYEKCIKCLPELCENFNIISALESLDCFYQCLLSANLIYKRKFNDFLKSILTHPTQLQTENVMQIINVLHNLIEKFIQNECEADDDEQPLRKILHGLLQCLEILYDFVPTKIDNCNNDAIMIYDWLYKICHDNNIETKNMKLIHKLLFTQRIKAHDGEFFNSIAMQMEKILGQIQEVELKLNFELKSIATNTVESCVIYLCNTIKRQVDEVEYFITKAKSLYGKIKFDGDESSENCIVTLKTTERKICLQLIHITNTIIHLTNTQIPSGQQYMGSVCRILIQFYICLSNLTKHFILKGVTVSKSFDGTKFDQLIRIAGKPLAANIYRLITHIEENIFDAERKTTNPKLDKAIVLRETKSLPKLILHIENFNKFIILLSKKTKNNNLTNYLHIGTVRDFRIKSSDLRDALNKTQVETQNIELDEDDLNDEIVVNTDDGDDDDDDDDDNDNDNVDGNQQNDVNNDEIEQQVEKEIDDKSSNIINSGGSNSSKGSSKIVEIEPLPNSTETVQFYNNLDKINEKCKKRKLRNNNNNDAVEIGIGDNDDDNDNRRKRIRRKSIMKINKNSVKQ